MKVLLGPAPCRDCRTTVWVAYRTIAFYCASHGRVCNTESIRPSVIEDDGSTHLCGSLLTGEHPFDIIDGAGASGEPNRLNVAPVSQLAPGPRASFHVGSKTT